jgi:hypothetical protein
MQFTLKNNTIKIDNGDHYYTGDICSEMFPEEIRDNYLDIIEKSFNNFTDEEYSVLRDFEDTGRYIINFHYKSKPFSFKRTIEIPMALKEKDFKDYTNERIEKLEEQIKKLNESFQTVQLSIQQKSEMLEDNDEDDDEEEEEEEEEEDASSVEVPIKPVVPIKARGGKVVEPIFTVNNSRKVRQNQTMLKASNC